MHFFKIKNNEIYNYNTRANDMICIPHESQISSSVVAKIWNALRVIIDVNATFINFKKSLKVYLLSNTLIMSYPK